METRSRCDVTGIVITRLLSTDSSFFRLKNCHRHHQFTICLSLPGLLLAVFPRIQLYWLYSESLEEYIKVSSSAPPTGVCDFAGRTPIPSPPRHSAELPHIPSSLSNLTAAWSRVFGGVCQVDLELGP